MDYNYFKIKHSINKNKKATRKKRHITSKGMTFGMTMNFSRAIRNQSNRITSSKCWEKITVVELCAQKINFKLIWWTWAIFDKQKLKVYHQQTVMSLKGWIKGHPSERRKTILGGRSEMQKWWVMKLVNTWVNVNNNLYKNSNNKRSNL